MATRKRPATPKADPDPETAIAADLALAATIKEAREFFGKFADSLKGKVTTLERDAIADNLSKLHAVEAALRSGEEVADESTEGDSAPDTE